MKQKTREEIVREFHKAFNVGPAGETLPQLMDRRYNLMLEELMEINDAMDAVLENPNSVKAWAHLLSELEDEQYVLSGTVDELGFTEVFQEGFNITHKNNMGKVWPDGKVHYREDGKVLKPEGYEKVNLEHLVEPKQLELDV